MNWKTVLFKIRFWVMAAFCVLFLGLFASQWLPFMEPSREKESLAVQATLQVSAQELYPFEIKPKATISTILRAEGVSAQDIHKIVLVTRELYDLEKIRPGTRFSIRRDQTANNNLIEVGLRISPSEFLSVTRVDGEWKANRTTEFVETRVVTFSGIVESSLWKSAEKVAMDPNLISELSEIFGWQIDFAREVQDGDQWRLSVEQKLVRGEPIGWGSILAAEYHNRGETHTAILFKLNEKEFGYFAPDGSSLRRMFLKSPIKFGRITSRFSHRRFHPILQIHRPHHGVDYAAPIGTPIRSVGDGVVSFAGWQGGGGRVIKVRHNSTYSTAYKHLNGFAPKIANGTRVQQGQVIGFVGNTGLSTAPHLHFEFFENNRFVDPLGKRFPSADPVPRQHMSEFRSRLPSILSLLPDWRLPTLRQASQAN
jgi:murein DD-endopeptidase MepM/ murein hydrolase activator NlpD